MATYDELSKNYASNARKEYENSLSYLTNDLKAQQTLDQQALQTRYDNLLAQINRQIDPVNQQYSRDAKSAYINKMLADRALDTSLSQLGVSSQGFGINQRLKNENAYGQNLVALQQSRDEGLRDIANQAADAMGDYNVAATELDRDYLSELSNLNRYIQEQGDNYYNNQYANYLADLKYQDEQKQYADALKQQEWENAFKQQQYADTIKQQQWENAFQQKQLDEQARQANLGSHVYYHTTGGSGGGSGSQGNDFGWVVGTTYKKNSDGSYTYTNPNGASSTVSAGVNPYTGTKNPDTENGTMGNGYQPNNVNGVKLKVAEKQAVNVNGNTQNVYSARKVGKLVPNYYVWNGQINEYQEVYKASNGEWYVK